MLIVKVTTTSISYVESAFGKKIIIRIEETFTPITSINDIYIIDKYINYGMKMFCYLFFESLVYIHIHFLYNIGIYTCIYK